MSPYPDRLKTGQLARIGADIAREPKHLEPPARIFDRNYF